MPVPSSPLVSEKSLAIVSSAILFALLETLAEKRRARTQRNPGRAEDGEDLRQRALQFLLRAGGDEPDESALRTLQQSAGRVLMQIATASIVFLR